MSNIKVENAQPETILRQVSALQQGHFLLTSGMHSDQYVQCQKVMQYPRYSKILANLLVDQILAAGLEPQAVVGPALGAVHWEVFIAAALDERYQSMQNDIVVKAIFAEKITDNNTTEFAIRRGVEISAGEKVLVVEDVTTTGGSAQKVVNLMRDLGAEPIAVGAIVDRSGGKVNFGLPFLKLITLNLEVYKPEECKFCASGLPLVKLGSGKKVS